MCANHYNGLFWAVNFVITIKNCFFCDFSFGFEVSNKNWVHDF